MTARTTPYTRENMNADRPMPRERTTTETMADPGFFNQCASTESQILEERSHI
jgi:hypothetical protein